MPVAVCVVGVAGPLGHLALGVRSEDLRDQSSARCGCWDWKMVPCHLKKKQGEGEVIVRTAGIIFVQTKAPPKLNREKYGSK